MEEWDNLLIDKSEFSFFIPFASIYKEKNWD